MTNYRIKRNDKHNIIIQRQLPSGTWKTTHYCGNSPKALIRSLRELLVTEYVPEHQNILEALDSLENVLREHIQKMEEWISHENFEFIVGRKKMTQKAKKFLRMKALATRSFTIDDPKKEGGLVGSMVGLGYVKRQGNTYKLTEEGKEWIERGMD